MRSFALLAVLCALAAWIAWDASRGPDALATPALLPAGSVRASDDVAAIADPRGPAAVEAASQRELAPSTDVPRPASRTSHAELRVRVVSSDDGKPLERARVHATTDRLREDGTRVAGTGVVTAITDDGGLASLAVPAEVELRITVPFTSAHASSLVAVTPLRASETRELVIAVATHADRELRGRVVDASTSSPVANAVVRAIAVELHELDSGEIDAARSRATGEVLTSEDGSFVLSMRSWSDEALLVDAPWYAVGTHEIDERRHEDVRIELVPAARLCVRFVSESGTPGDGLVVRARIGGARSPSLAELDAESRACFEIALGEQQVALEVLRSRGGGESKLIARAEVRFTARARTEETVELVERPTPPITGCLRDDESSPIAGARVVILSANDDLPLLVDFEDVRRPVAEAVTDDFGCFTVRDVPVGRYWIALAPHSPPQGEHPAFAAVGTPFRVDASGAPTLDVRCAAAQWIEGRVLDGDVGSETAYVRAESSAWSGSVRVGVRNGGRFWLGPLPAGTFDVVAEGDGLRASSPRLRIAAGASGIVLERPLR